MVSIAVSKMGMTKLIFVNSGISHWPVLPRCLTLSADAASDQACCRRYVCLSARQHSISSCQRHLKLL